MPPNISANALLCLLLLLAIITSEGTGTTASPSSAILYLDPPPGDPTNHASPSRDYGVKIIHPSDGQVLEGGQGEEGVAFHFSVYGSHLIPRGTRLCFTVVGRQYTYYQWTVCLDNPDEPYRLTNFEPGVWRARAYLVAEDQQPHWKGGHDEILGQDDIVYFVVSSQGWRQIALLDMLDSLDPSLRTSPSVSPLFSQALPSLPRLRALEVAHAMIRDTALSTKLRWWSGTSPAGDKYLITLMLNGGHLPLARNAIFFLDRLGLLEHTVLYSLGAEVCDMLLLHDDLSSSSHRLHCVNMPGIESACPGCEGTRDVWSSGFSDIAVFKPACVLTGLALGIDVLWMDTDIVLLKDPIPYLYSSHYHHANLTIQAGGVDSVEVPKTPEQQFRSELCTGFYLARTSPGMTKFFQHVIVAMALHENITHFGDQSATNLILFESMFRGISPLTVSVLDPLDFVGGGVFFTTSMFGDLRSGWPTMIHNNFIIGLKKKVERFKTRGLWYETWREDHLQPDGPIMNSGQDTCSYDTTTTMDQDALTSCLSQFQEALPPGTQIDVVLNPPAHTRRAMGVLVLGERPWFQSVVLPRMKDYASRVSADLVIVHGENCMSPHEDMYDFRTCATFHKLNLLKVLLECYDRVLLIDDTALIRRDCPDLFALVPDTALGACLEDHLLRDPQENEALVRLSSLMYHTNPRDDLLWFNSGVMVLSRVLLGQDKHQTFPIPEKVDPILQYDQGYMCALRNHYGWPIKDLGYRFNYVGSFEGSNAWRRPLKQSSDAFIIHATTGLPDSSISGRKSYLEKIHQIWLEKGL